MRVQDLTDQKVGDRCHVSRSAIEARRAGDTRITLKDVGLLSRALDVDPALFSMEPDEALSWYAENRKELLRTPTIWTVPSPVAA